MSHVNPFKRLLGGLKDFQFEDLVTPVAVGVLFVLALIYLGLFFVAYLLAAAFADTAGLSLLLVVTGALYVGWLLIQFRVTFEIIAVIFRIWSMRRERTDLLRQITT